MSSSALALQHAVSDVLAADAGLVSALGGARRVFEHVPPGASLPYIVFGPFVTRDWSTGSDSGAEHTLTLYVWTNATSRRTALDLSDRIRALLHDQPLVLDGHRLVNLRHDVLEIRRERDGRHVRAAVRFRAVTERA